MLYKCAYSPLFDIKSAWVPVSTTAPSFMQLEQKKKKAPTSALVAIHEPMARHVCIIVWSGKTATTDVHDQVRVFRQVSEPMRHEDHRSPFSFLPEVGKEPVFCLGIEG